MSNATHEASQLTSNRMEKSSTPKQSLQSKNGSLDKETIINGITGYECDLTERLEMLEREAEVQARENELNECLEYIAQLVDLFKRSIIATELENEHDCHDESQRHSQKHRGSTGNSHLDEKMEKIILDKGLTKEQWSGLLYIAFNVQDTTELSKVNKKHLQKVHDMSQRVLDDNEQNAVTALLNAIETHMDKKYFTDK